MVFVEAPSVDLTVYPRQVGCAMQTKAGAVAVLTGLRLYHLPLERSSSVFFVLARPYSFQALETPYEGLRGLLRTLDASPPSD
jgi:hypothetical protein